MPAQKAPLLRVPGAGPIPGGGILQCKATSLRAVVLEHVLAVVVQHERAARKLERGAACRADLHIACQDPRTPSRAVVLAIVQATDVDVLGATRRTRPHRGRGGKTAVEHKMLRFLYLCISREDVETQTDVSFVRFPKVTPGTSRNHTPEKRIGYRHQFLTTYWEDGYQDSPCNETTNTPAATTDAAPSVRSRPG